MSDYIQIECKVCGWRQYFLDYYCNHKNIEKLQVSSKSKIISSLHKAADMIDDMKWLYYIDYMKDKEKKCPECGGNLIRISGCVSCQDCAWSKCN